MQSLFGLDNQIGRRVRTVLAALVMLAATSAADATPQETGDPEAGKALYDARCSLCHGPAGAGDGPLAESLPVKPSDWTAGGGGLKSMEDEQVFDVIARGGVAVGKSETMPANPQLSESEVWNLVAHVKSLKADVAPESDSQEAREPEAVPAPVDHLKWGSALDWAVVMTIGLSALILTLILVSLVVYREQQAEGNALWLHLLSLGILPLLILAVGNFAVLEEAKQVRFCGACHITMKPYIADMRDRESGSLAALHYQHRAAPGTDCYSCHANYGVHGTFRAKLTGLVDVYKYVTRTYELPLEMRAPFDNVLCLKCHDGAKRFMAEKIHLDGGEVSEGLRTGKFACELCHAPAHDIPEPDPVMSRAVSGP